jgi:tetratricopeptide (TPR) repeat protein
VAELVRGNVTDRPWGRTFAAFGLRGVTGQLTVVADGKRFLVAFESGAVVSAASPLASDAAARVALTNHLVSSSQVSEISRRQAAAPGRDEIELVAELARIGPDHALRLRRRVIAQRAARTFSINHGEFVVTDHTELAILPGCELDIRAVIYMGARTNLSEQRLSAELDQLGSWFRLKPAVDDDLPQFGFTDLEQPVVERLRDGGTLGELEEFATSFVDERTVRAVVYALAVCNACDLGPPKPAAAPARPLSSTLPPLAGATPRPATPTHPGVAIPRTTSPLLRAAPPLASEAPRAATVTPSSVAQRAQTPVTPVTPPPAAPPVRTAPGTSTTRPGPISASRAASPPEVLAAGSAVFTPITEGLDAPTQRDGSSPAIHRPPEAAFRQGSSPAIRRPPAEATQRDVSSPGIRLPFDDTTPQDLSLPGMHPSLTAPTQRDGSSPAIRRPVSEATPRDGSSPAIHRPPEAATTSRERREDSNAEIRWPFDETVPSEASSPSLRPSLEEATLREGWSSPEIRQPLPEATPSDMSNPAIRRPLAGMTPGEGSSPAVRLPVDADGLQLEPVILRVPSARPPPRRRNIRPTDSPQSHDVKALIAQRLKLLDHGADHFQLLGVAQDVAQDALRKAYFALARQLHPDRLAALGIPDDGKHAQRLFAQINAGFAILSDQERRSRYLDVLRRGGEAAVRAEQARTEELTRRILDAEEAFHRAELALRRDQPQAAVTELELAIQLNPDEADYHALLAWSQFCAAPDKMAVASKTRVLLDHAIHRSPKAVAARFYLGRVERMLGHDQEALRHFRDVLAISPAHVEAAAELRVIEARLASGDKPASGLFGRFNKR